MLCAFDPQAWETQSLALREAFQRNAGVVRRSDRFGYSDYVVAAQIQPDIRKYPIVSNDDLKVWVFCLRRERRATYGLLSQYELHLCESEALTPDSGSQAFSLQATDDPFKTIDVLCRPELRRQALALRCLRRGERILAPWSGQVEHQQQEDGNVMILIKNAAGERWKVARFKPSEWAAIETFSTAEPGSFVAAGVPLVRARRETYYGMAHHSVSRQVPMFAGPTPDVFELGLELFDSLAGSRLTQQQLAGRMPKLLVEADSPPLDFSNGNSMRARFLAGLGPNGNWCLKSRYAGQVQAIQQSPDSPGLWELVIQDATGSVFRQNILADSVLRVSVGDEVSVGSPVATPVERRYYSRWVDLEVSVPPTMADWLLSEFVAEHCIEDGQAFDTGAWAGGTLWPAGALDLRRGTGWDVAQSATYWDIRHMNFPENGLLVLGSVTYEPPCVLDNNFVLSCGLPPRKRLTRPRMEQPAMAS